MVKGNNFIYNPVSVVQCYCYSFPPNESSKSVVEVEEHMLTIFPFLFLSYQIAEENTTRTQFLF